MPVVTIDPPFSTIHINGHTYTNDMWEANPQGTFSAIANDIGALVAGAGYLPADGLAGQVLTKATDDDFDVEWSDRPIMAMAFVPGLMESSLLTRLVTTDKMEIPVGFTDSRAWTRVPSTGDVEVTINKISGGTTSVEIGTVTFEIGNYNGIFDFEGTVKVTVNEGDMIEYVWPVSVDATLSDVTISIRAVKVP